MYPASDLQPQKTLLVPADVDASYHMLLYSPLVLLAYLQVKYSVFSKLQVLLLVEPKHFLLCTAKFRAMNITYEVLAHTPLSIFLSNSPAQERRLPKNAIVSVEV